MEGFSITFLIFSLIYTHKMTNAADIITETQFIKDGQTIVSSDGTFEMGFFSPGDSMNRYVGIWYHKQLPVKTVVWVANRKIPLTDKSGVLKIINPAILVILNATSSIIWSSNASRSTAQNPVARLLNSGNLVVREANDDNPDNVLWQTFDYPTDTFLPGMKLGKNFVTGLETSLSSWKSNDDPAPGEYTYHLDPTGFPQFVLKKGSVELFRGGPWNGVTFSGAIIKKNPIFTFEFVFNEKEVHYSYKLINNSVLSRFLLNHTGFSQRWIWQEQGWSLYFDYPKDNCDAYSRCGPYGRCKVDDFPICGCLDKFVTEYQEGGLNFPKGCARKTPLELDCRNGQGDGDVFIKYSGMKLPDTRSSWFDRSMNLEECESACLKNCSCTAYTNLDIRGDGSGCLLWFGDLLDMRVFATGQDIYIRMASSELDPQSDSERRKGVIIGVSISLVVVIIMLGLGLTMYVQKRKTLYLKREGRQGHDFEQDDIAESQKGDVELPLFGLSTIANATNNFSIENKLGEGGFGPVYKAVLEEGQEIAVKRLSKTSNQGLVEFKNEVICVAKLQHRNLVKLLGCCIQGEEKMLIYEYMPNKSLDKFIFGEAQSKLLDWPKRFHIINGIARGLLYLHQDSRLRIIHRDLKASNVLLDFDMNPKISDFGMARSFGGNETATSTKRVVGTYGYMSPEYAVDGIFSVKSDVFSFGVLVLEIVSGKRNRGFTHCDHYHNLLGHAWRLYNEGRSLELMDATVPADDSCYVCEVLLLIQVGLLCVQQCPEDRPSMSSVVLMLGSERALPRPKQPGFFAERTIFEAQCSSSLYASSSNNEITLTQLNGR